MVLNLDHYNPTKLSQLKMFRVKSAKECNIWTEVASQSFAYSIDSSVIKNIVNADNMNLLMLFHNNTPIATSMLYSTGDVVGIHLVGVLPSYRGKGYARQLMQYLLNDCKTSVCRYVTLHASSMGKNLYRELGFNDQFDIINYTTTP